VCGEYTSRSRTPSVRGQMADSRVDRAASSPSHPHHPPCSSTWPRPAGPRPTVDGSTEWCWQSSADVVGQRWQQSRDKSTVQRPAFDWYQNRWPWMTLNSIIAPQSSHLVSLVFITSKRTSCKCAIALFASLRILTRSVITELVMGRYIGPVGPVSWFMTHCVWSIVRNTVSRYIKMTWSSRAVFGGWSTWLVADRSWDWVTRCAGRLSVSRPHTVHRATLYSKHLTATSTLQQSHNSRAACSLSGY